MDPLDPRNSTTDPRLDLEYQPKVEHPDKVEFSPANYSRRDRRAMGQRGRTVEKIDSTYVPRFLRRHVDQLRGTTRRDRKARAKAELMMRSKGML